ncbi:hypothetical protein NDU88_001739 [Pleurodeles waltl]|uniref:Uncharacterized protein n=1 Tax=Pleurodeles waltl TaxID=8319 RepID=A0AAV7Q4W5_PLEWA|nr:hypothetical protein NDU88_001739 [Pleurodeles waltl]
MNGVPILGVSVAKNGPLFYPESPRGRGRSTRLIRLTAFKRGITALCWNECERRPGESLRPRRYAAAMFPPLLCAVSFFRLARHLVERPLRDSQDGQAVEAHYAVQQSNRWGLNFITGEALRTVWERPAVSMIYCPCGEGQFLLEVYRHVIVSAVSLPTLAMVERTAKPVGVVCGCMSTWANSKSLPAASSRECSPFTSRAGLQTWSRPPLLLKWAGGLSFYLCPPS